MQRGLWLAALVLPGWAQAAEGPRVPVLTTEQTWKTLPPVAEGYGQPLPAWIRALAVSLPRTAAAMIDLDHAQRAESPLPPRLRARLRWMAADANRCEYGRAYARADYLRAGGKAEEIDDLPRRLEQLPEAERLALQLVRRLAEAAYTVSDAQMERLIALHGEKQAVAIVLVAAYACFQDRLVLALGVDIEPGGPLPPVKVRFRKPLVAAKKEGAAGAEKPASRRQLSPPAKNPPTAPTRLPDSEWSALPFDNLRLQLSRQKTRRQGRIRIPTWEIVRDSYPAGMPRPAKPIRIAWTLVALGYQPRLTAAWLTGLRTLGVTDGPQGSNARPQRGLRRCGG
jgi:alkylhydroperoxidase family enzyme